MENFGNNNMGDPFAAQGNVNYNAQPPMSKKEFFKKYAPASFKKTILIASIVAYVMVGINVILVLTGSIASILDVAITLALTLGVHVGKSKGCAIGLTVYGAINLIIASLMAGSLTGWGWLVVAIAYLEAFIKAEKEYKAVYGG